MISQISLTDIHKTLSDHVEIGDPNSKGLPTVDIKKIEKNKPRLYGEVNNSNFAITFNLPEEVCPFILKGELIYIDQKQTEVNYRVKIMRIPKILFILVLLSVHIFTLLMLSEELIFALSSLVFYFAFWAIFIVNFKSQRLKLKELENYFKMLVQIHS
jgi:phage-related holin